MHSRKKRIGEPAGVYALVDVNKNVYGLRIVGFSEQAEFFSKVVIFWETASPEIIYDEDGKTIVVDYDSEQVVLEVRREEYVELIANILNDGEIDGCDWRAFKLTHGQPGLNIIHGARVNSWLDTFIV